MKVLFDYAAFVMQSRGGVSRVLYELFQHLSARPGMECKLFAGFHRNQYLRDAPKHVRRHIIGWHLPEWMVKQRIFMPINRWLFKFYARRFLPDICHYTYFDTPVVPADCKVVVTIHDMITELFPEMYASDDPQHGWKKNAVGRADGIICVSENTRQDLVRLFDVEGKKCAVIHHGSSLEAVDPERIDVAFPYLLYVGTRGVEYKNFNLILRALNQCKDQTSSHLMCFGGGSFSVTEKKKIEGMKLSGRIHQVGGSDARLAGYYANARALIYPSKYEGFGLPPIEAMGFECPVIVSNAPPMPEIVGDGGLYFDPDDVTSLIDRILSLEDDSIRREIVRKGRDRGALFAWSRMADAAVDFYRTLL